MRGPHHHFADLMQLLMLLILLVILLVASPVGLRLLASIGNSAGIGLDIKGVNGTLLNGLTIESLSWKGKDTTVELKKIKLDLHGTKYSNNALNIRDLSASALNIYITSSTKRREDPVSIPDIPIFVNLVADQVQLDTLRIIRDKKELLFKIDQMEVENVSIIDNQLLANAAMVTPIIADSPMDIWLNTVAIDFNEPHLMSASGTLQYSHFQLGDFDGDVTVGGALTDYQLQADINWDENVLGRSRVKFEGYGDYDKATINSMNLDHSEGMFDAKGGIAWRDKFSWNATVLGTNVRSRKFAPQWPAVVDMNFNSFGAYSYSDKKWLMSQQLNDLNGKVDGFPVKASGAIILENSILRTSNLSVKIDKNKMLLNGRITEPFDLQWDVDAKNIGQLIPGYKGSIVGKGVATGTTFEPRGFGKLKIRGLNAEGVTIEEADIDLQAGAENSLLAGKGNAKLKNFQFEDFKVVFADIQFDGKENKSLMKGKGVIQLDQLTSEDVTLLSAKINFDGSDEFLKLNGDVQQLKIVGQKIDSAKLEAKGTLENHQFKVLGKSNQGDLILNAKGGWALSKWQGVIDKMSVSDTQTGNWLLKKPVRINVASNGFSGSEICMVNPKRGQLCADTEWNSTSISSKGKLLSVPLSQLEPWLPSSIDLSGVVNAVFDIQHKQQGLEGLHGLIGSAEFQLPDSFVELETEGGKKEKLAYHDGKVLIKFKDEKMDIKVSVDIEKRGKFSSQSVITLDPKSGRHRISGDAKLDVMSLAWTQEFFPDITKLKGIITSKVKFKGLLAKPEYSGQVELKNGHLSIPDTGTELSNIALLIKTARPNQATIQGSLEAKTGKLNVNGVMKINKLNDWLAELKLKGNNLQFMNTHEVQAFASPDLSLTVIPGQADIKGTFHVPKAHIKLSELPETAIYESDDVVYLGTVKNTRFEAGKMSRREEPLRILPNVGISLGEEIHFEGFGLTSKLKGKFHIGHNRSALISRGTLTIENGEYRAYGQRMTIEHGVLVFNGPIGNPGLDIRATRSIDDIKVGINLAGTLQKPKSSIFSDPPQSESDALSYLITGQSLSETSGDQTQLLVQAVRTLGINSGSTMLNRIGGSVGLDDLNIITYGDYKKNKLQLGKRLGTNLYIRYITGLFDTFHKIAVDYKIGSKWSLQAESGEAQGIDFIYDIDTN